MGRSQESFNKKEVRNKKEKKRKEKEQKRLARRDGDKSGNLDDMIAYVDEHGNLSSTPPDPDKKKEEIDVDEIQISVPKKSDEEEDPIRKGTVNAYFESKGFGFIKDSETKEGVFFHVNNVVDDIREGNFVSFEVEMGPKGPVAVNVRQIK
jgi:cold shock CspA family protein